MSEFKNSFTSIPVNGINVQCTKHYIYYYDIFAVLKEFIEMIYNNRKLSWACFQ